MERYFVWHDLHAPSPRHWNVVDRRDGGYDRETGARYIASCPDPEMAQRLADLLNIPDETFSDVQLIEEIRNGKWS